MAAVVRVVPVLSALYGGAITLNIPAPDDGGTSVSAPSIAMTNLLRLLIVTMRYLLVESVKVNLSPLVVPVSPNCLGLIPNEAMLPCVGAVTSIVTGPPDIENSA